MYLQILIDEYLFWHYNTFQSCRLAVGHFRKKGGDAYDYMDRDFYILSGVNRSCFLVKEQVERKEKAAPDKDGQTLI